MKNFEQQAETRATFPIIRHISARVTPFLLKTPICANHITLISILLGLTAGAMFAIGEFTTTLYASIVFFLVYLLDHCDGEVARAKSQASKFGEYFDTFGDWISHAAFFIGLGYGTYTTSNNHFWFWMGLAAALGATINYIISIYLCSLKEQEKYLSTVNNKNNQDSRQHPKTRIEVASFIFRELCRADFWLLVLILAIFDLVWILLPASAFGAQAYWITLLITRGKQYRV